MAISTPVNKGTLKNHWDYNKWKYFLLVILALVASKLIYDVTEYKAPDDARINVIVQSDTTSEGMLHLFLDPVWQSAVPQEEELNLRTIMKADETTALQQIFTMVIAEEGDIYLLSNKVFRQYAAKGIFVPLETLIGDGRLNISGINFESGYEEVVLEMDYNNNPIKTERHLYGIPVGNLPGFVETGMLGGDELYACICVNNGNEDDVITFFNAMLQYGRTTHPVMEETE